MVNKLTKPQEVIAGIMGWSRGQVSQYAMLKQISTEAWRLIATEMENNRSKPDDDGVADNATVVAKGIFSEYTLREIVSLTPSQQLELVKGPHQERTQSERGVPEASPALPCSQRPPRGSPPPLRRVARRAHERRGVVLRETARLDVGLHLQAGGASGPSVRTPGLGAAVWSGVSAAPCGAPLRGCLSVPVRGGPSTPAVCLPRIVPRERPQILTAARPLSDEC